MVWRFATSSPPDGWQASGFDDASWNEGQGAFGRKSTPDPRIRTPWTTPDIWLRRSFEASLPEAPSVLVQFVLRVQHDDEFEAYLNGKEVARGARHSPEHYTVVLEDSGALLDGRNLIAVHCHSIVGDQYIDVGLLAMIAVSE